MNHDRFYHESADSSRRTSTASGERGIPAQPQPTRQTRPESSAKKLFGDWGHFGPGRYGFLHLRRFTLLPEAELQHRPQAQHYIIRQPRSLQYYIDGKYIDATGRQVGFNDSVKHLMESIRDEDVNGHSRHASQHRADPNHEGTLQTRSRLDLIIDLVWVGITVNISKTFEVTAFDNNTSYGNSFLLFLILFLLSFRMWDQLRAFLNSYFNGDAFQALFILWILVLGLIFGNNALKPVQNEHLNFLVYIYLISRGSFWLAEFMYAAVIKELRQQFYIHLLVNLISTSCLVGSIWVKWQTKTALILTAMFLELLMPAVMQLSLVTTYLHTKVQLAIDAEHYTERLEAFFILMIGEGILLLIKDGTLVTEDSDQRVTNRFGVGALTLMSLYLIAILYFNGDMSRRYIHAVKRNKYSAHIYLLLHVILYAALLIFDAGIAYLVKYNEEKQGDKDEMKYPWQHAARWMVSISLASIFLSISLLGLLNKPMPDRPGAPRMVIPNRYLRLLPRLIFMIIVVCLPIVDSMRSTHYLGIVTGIVMLVALWEYFACLEIVNGKIVFVEPRNIDTQAIANEMNAFLEQGREKRDMKAEPEKTNTFDPSIANVV